MPKSIENVFYKGPCYTVEYAVTADGRMPAKEDLDRLKRKNLRRYSRFKLLFIQFAKTGTLPPSKLDEYKGTKLKKFKHSEAYPYRVPCFFVGNRVILTHLFAKKGRKQISAEIEKAKRIMNEHMAHCS
jgi:phage-related protein